MKRKRTESLPLIRRLAAAVLCLVLAGGAVSFAAAEASPVSSANDWVNFLLICNEGMNNNTGNAGNTLMVLAMHPSRGLIRMLMFTWDTFIDYPGYDVPQRLDMPYRNQGAEEAVEVFNQNFETDIEYFMSLNYLNLASLIDEYGGVTVDITRAERNALNGMVASKKNQLLSQSGTGLLTQTVIDMLAGEYYLNDFGPDTHLNGLQAVGYGWLQYDSVYNCCERDAEVIGSLFYNAGKVIGSRVAFYTDETGEPEFTDGRRPINLDHPTEQDYAFLREQMAPMFQMSYNNLPEEKIHAISLALARVAWEASREGVNIFEHLSWIVLPLEAQDPYDIVAGTKGHLVDKKANGAAIREYLYGSVPAK